MYAPTLGGRAEYADTFYAFHNELQSVIKNVKCTIAHTILQTNLSFHVK